MLPLPRSVAGALEQRRQQREHRRRIALRGRRLAGRQADLALRHREARHRVHHQQHVLALVAEVLGDRRGARRPRACRTSGGLSEVETTTTDRARPSGPRSCSRKLRTSRPRSPTSASTTTSAAVPRAIMPSSVLLPTPLPPNRPMRWPRPQVSSASMARTPVPSGAPIGSRASGLSAARPQRRALGRRAAARGRRAAGRGRR